jgi:hypothetical protein
MAREVRSTDEPSPRQELARRGRPTQPADSAPQALGPEVILRLQQTAGNAAVARMIQRKIGFEFEADAWYSWRRLRNLTQAESSTSPALRTLPVQDVAPLKKKDPIHQGTGYTLEADESKNKDALGRGKSDIEFVTVPFEEDAGGLRQLKDTLDAIEADAADLCAMRYADEFAGSYNMFEELVAAGLSPPTGILLSGGDRPLTVKMQATFGLRLDRVLELMSSLGAAQPGESARKAAQRAEGRDFMSRHAGGLAMPQGAGMQEVGAAAARATAGVRAFKQAHAHGTPNYDPAVDRLKNTKALEGLLSMIGLYLGLGDKISAGASYPKAIAAIMARTDFAAMFTLLPQDQKILLTKGDNLYWFELVGMANPGLNLSAQLFKGAPWLQELYRDDWLENIPKGTDIVGQSGYQQLANAMLPTAGIATTGTMLGESHLLESMGSMGEKTEGDGDRRLAIFELRAIPDYFPYDQIGQISRAVAKYIAGLNKGKSVTFER